MTCPELTTFHNGYWETPTHFHLGGHVEAKCNYKYVVPSSGERKTQDIWCEANGTWSQVQDCVKGSSQATDLDVWASRVKCPARFVSHLHEICIYIWVVYSICLLCCLFIIVTWWYVWCIVWQGWDQFNSGIGIAAQFQFQFWNWNLNWWNCKWNWNWRLWNWNWKPELNFLQLLPQHLLVNQQFPNFSFNRGHNLIFHVTDSSCNRI